MPACIFLDLNTPLLNFLPFSHLGFSSLRHRVHLGWGAAYKQRASFYFLLLLLVLMLVVLLAAFAATVGQVVTSEHEAFFLRDQMGGHGQLVGVRTE